MLLRLKERNKLLGRVAGELVLKEVEGDAMKIKHPDFLIRLDDFWKDFTVILYQDGMGRSVAHSRGDMRDTVSHDRLREPEFTQPNATFVPLHLLFRVKSCWTNAFVSFRARRNFGGCASRRCARRTTRPTASTAARSPPRATRTATTGAWWTWSRPRSTTRARARGKEKREVWSGSRNWSRRRECGRI